ncbi:MAG TPA: thioredoxin domain-containing protein [Candidatus Gracilibacteria bacterium]
MKKILLIILALSLTACSPKQPPVVNEDFVPRETVELEAVDEIIPEEMVEALPEEIVEALSDGDDLFAEEDLEDLIAEEEIVELEPIELPEEVLAEIKDDKIMELEEETSDLYPSVNARKIKTLKGDQISITYFFDYTASNLKSHEDMIKKIGGKFGPSILWIYRPLGSFGASALGAKASECARIQKAWPGFHDKLVALEGNITELSVNQAARDYSLDMSQFKKCMAASDTDKQLDRYSQEAQNFRVEATPAFVVGEDVVFSGNYPPAFFEQMIQSFLSSRLGN